MGIIIVGNQQTLTNTRNTSFRGIEAGTCADHSAPAQRAVRRRLSHEAAVAPAESDATRISRLKQISCTRASHSQPKRPASPGLKSAWCAYANGTARFDRRAAFMRPWFILHIARCMLQVDLIVYMVSCRSHASHCKQQVLSCRYQLHAAHCTSYVARRALQAACCATAVTSLLAMTSSHGVHLPVAPILRSHSSCMSESARPAAHSAPVQQKYVGCTADIAAGSPPAASLVLLSNASALMIGAIVRPTNSST